MQSKLSSLFCKKKQLYLGIAYCYNSATLHVVQGGHTLVLRKLAADLCRNDNGISFLDHRNDCNQTN